MISGNASVDAWRVNLGCVLIKCSLITLTESVGGGRILCVLLGGQMLYQFIEYQRTLLKPLTVWAAGVTNAFADPDSLFAHIPGAQCVAAGYELLYRFSKTYEKPEFGITEVEQDGRKIPVVEQI